MKKIYLIFSVLAVISLFGIANKSYAQNSPLLYFCEEYIDGVETGVSNKFTTGWLTVMLDTRPTGKTIGTNKVKLKLTKIRNENGENIQEEFVDLVPFDVEPDWDYIYFTDKGNLKFNSPGTYRVVCLKANGIQVGMGEVEIISK